MLSNSVARSPAMKLKMNLQIIFPNFVFQDDFHVFHWFYRGENASFIDNIYYIPVNTPLLPIGGVAA
jgi:hypothetical protein